MGLDLWDLRGTEMALFHILLRISICILWGRSHLAFGFKLLLQLDEAPAQSYATS